ncbi:gas vesicle structural protein GvpA [Streptomyces sp. NPDC056716]|uniref:gas vesicle structural protein GvpA n=1 Tax=unclassified Streptomyces TaxID=2593676 RepID=UPI0036B55D03
MTVVPAQQQSGQGGGSLYDVLELVLDRGLVIDAFIRVSLVGIEILKIDVRVVVASVDTYLRFAEACNRLDLEAGPHKNPGLPDLVGEVTESGARGKSKGALTGAVETVTDAFRQGRDDDSSREQEQEREPEREREPRQRPRKATATRRREREDES